MIKISIILPVHNAIEYIEDTLISIQKQTFLEYELIIIDDGSIDGSVRVCEEYAEKDNRIKIFKYANLGISQARNMGIAHANGEYICFCDHDDLYEEGILNENYLKAKEYDADVVKFGVRCIQIFANGVRREIPNYNRIIQSGYIKKTYTEQCFLQYNMCSNLIWNGMYKTVIIKDNQLRFPEEMKFGCEDGYFCMDLFLYCKNIFYNKGNFYTHYSREKQSTNFKFSKNKIESQIMLWNKKQNVLANIQSSNRSTLYELCFAEMLIQIQSLLVHKDCDLNLYEKKRILDRVRKQSKKLSFTKIIFLIATNRKYGVVLLLFYLKLYALGLWIKRFKEYLNRKRLA